ncbi:MAG: hypothetical protein IT381_14915 [Deltaproteobacteria bacterium]|nr:hypothetical protein [Deltaproteobacteria bacterium]
MPRGPAGQTDEQSEACKNITCNTGFACFEGTCLWGGGGDDGSTQGSGKTPCNPNSQGGECGTPARECQGGICFVDGEEMPACGPATNGFCPDRQACVGGACTPIPADQACGASHPSGLCPGGESCIGGSCYRDDGTLFCGPSSFGGYCTGSQVCSGGTCVPVTAPLCAPATPAGNCPSWQVCVQGACFGPAPPDACSPPNPTGRCPADSVCIAGTCTPIGDNNVCGPNRPNGLCPAGSACQAGDCIDLTPLNQCSPDLPTGLCGNGEVCRDGQCVPTSCENGGLLCPQDRVCTSFMCVQMPCDPVHPTGVCSNAALICDRGACVTPTCSENVPNGSCPLGQFCSAGTCAPITCSVDEPNGTCPNGERCISGSCRLSGCRDQADPAAFCAPDECDTVLDVCMRPRCGANPPFAPDGRCTTPGEVCISGVCDTPACGPLYPGGECPSGQGCATTPSGVTCIALPCTLANQTGPCASGSGRICCNGSNEAPGGQLACNPSLHGQCVRKNCGPDAGDAGLTSPQGQCAPGFTCVSEVCTVVPCGAGRPTSPCPEFSPGVIADICVANVPAGPDGACIAVCDDATGPRGAAHLTGACPGGFVCVSGQCSPACKIGAGACAFNDLNCRDSDCDGRSDAAEGAQDNDDTGGSTVPPNPGDGVLDTDSTDTDGDLIPDALDPDNDGDGLFDRLEIATCGNPQSKDSDSDGIEDGVEARVNSANMGDPVSIPVNTDNDKVVGGPCDGNPKFDYIDPDSDNDMINDACEGRLNPNCSTGTVTTIAGLVDTDLDGNPDYRDLDSDDDGVPDNVETRVRPWRPATDGGNVNPLVPANHDNGVVGPLVADTIPDYRDPDSDGDGVNDSDEDVDGDGVVDCSIDNMGNRVPDLRPSPPAASCTQSLIGGIMTPPGFDDGAGHYWNPGCDSGAPGQKCYFAETSRTHPDSDLDGTNDQSDGLFVACSAANLKPVNIFTSQPADYEIALEQSFGVTRQLRRNNDTVGLLINDNVYDAGMNVLMTGSNGVAGFILQKRPANAAIMTDNGNTDVTQKLINKAVAQEVADRNAWRAASSGTQLTLAANGFTLILTRSFASADGVGPPGMQTHFGVVVSRYRIRTSADRWNSVMRDRIVKVLDGTVTGFPTEASLSNNAEGGLLVRDFILEVQTLYRFDTATSGTVDPTMENGSVIIVGAIVATGNDDLERSFSYVPACGDVDSDTQGECDARDGCGWRTSCKDRAGYCDTFTAAGAGGTCVSGSSGRCKWDALNSKCKENRPYQLPVFFADNITDGSAVTQYGDGLATACETFTQKIAKFDFLWTIDDSGSMGSEITEVKNGAQAFASLVDASESDYRLASIATDESIAGWDPNLGDARQVDIGINGALPATWTGGAPTAGATNHFTGKIQGECVGPATVDRTTNACNAVSYFQTRLPPDSNGSGREFSMQATMWQLYRAGASDKCSTIGTDPVACAATTGCAFFSGTCMESRCDVGTDAVSCDGREICELNKASAAICGQLPGCTYHAAATDCVTNICFTKNATTCPMTAGCTWTGSYCNDAVTMPQDQPEPNACEWSPSYQRCLPRMPFPCAGLGGACGTFSGVCTGACASKPENYEGCYRIAPGSCTSLLAPGCEVVGGVCRPQLGKRLSLCHSVTTLAACNAMGSIAGEAICAWDAGSSTCKPSPFRSFRDDQTVGRVLVAVTDEEECFNKDRDLDGGCEWLGYNQGILDYDPATAGGALRRARMQSYLRFMQARGITVFAITGDKADEALGAGVGNGGCNDSGNQADPNNTIINVAEGTGGGWGTICPSSLRPTIDSIVLQVLGQASPYRLSGPGQPISATIKVAVEVCKTPGTYPNCDAAGTEMKEVTRSRENGFDYNATFKSIVFYGTARPKNNGDIIVSYRYWVDETPGGSPACPCAQGLAPPPPGNTCQCATPGDVCAINYADFCAAASQGTCETPQVSSLLNCHWNNGPPARCEHECMTLFSELGCEGNPDCFWNEALSRCEIDYCAEARNPSDCDDVAGCTWNCPLANGCPVSGNPPIGVGGRCVPTGQCDTDPTCGGCPNGGVCNPQTGICTCQADCDGACGAGEICDVADTSGGQCGTCKCPQCPTGGCPSGTYCDPLGTTCGACACDQTCRSCTGPGCSPTGCTGTYVCSQSGATCGSCVPPPCQDNNDCPFGQQCVSGTCVCDASCGGATPPCPQGSVCDNMDPTSLTCGQCKCDTACGIGKACSGAPGSCGPNQQCVGGFCSSCQNGTVCDQTPTSCKCGTCRTPSTCTPSSCPPGQVCDACVGSCVIDPTCGGCDFGSTCDPSTGQCISTNCPVQAAPGYQATPATSPYCTAQNLNCCFGKEGISPYDADFDGYMDCNSDCGRTLDWCSGMPSSNPCDMNDYDPNVH